VLQFKYQMKTELLIAQGNTCREQRKPKEALSFYAQAFVDDADHANAFNNYGNVLREMGHPKRAIPFLQHALALEPTHSVAAFNLAVAYLLSGDYQNGWRSYESRWNYEHLAHTLPTFSQPRWTGQDLKDKVVLVVGEQGLGDNIQFARFLYSLRSNGATVILQVPDALVSLFGSGDVISQTVGWSQPLPAQFDYWVPIMSLPGVFNITLENFPKVLSYISAPAAKAQHWKQFLGIKDRIRIGFSWSGRRDSWINQHKALPFDCMFDLIARNPQYQWINLQADATVQESVLLEQLGVSIYPGAIQDFSDTAGLLANLDLVISVDTAVAHLAGSMGVPLWMPLNKYAVDWRWLLDRDDSPWYQTAVLYRQSEFDKWDLVIDRIHKHLTLLKI
jgi:tetratricopeptide (TPR) repeat protein